jgi:prepilin-type N-terminal cleavage/methylation domain-containing protein
MKRQGFTLIELLIVMTIIMILVAMSMVAYSTVQGTARRSGTQGLIGKIEIALRTYKEVFLEFPPDGTHKTDGTNMGSQNLWYYLYQGSMEEDSDDPKVFRITVKAPDPRFADTGIYKKFTPAIGPEGFKKRELDSEHYILDAWGLRLQYKNPGEEHTGNPEKGYRCKDTSHYVDLESWGSNGKDDPDDSPDDDDINNWKTPR